MGNIYSALSQGGHIAPGDQNKLCFTTLSLIPMVSIVRLGVVKQSSFGLPGQYGRRVTRVNAMLFYFVYKVNYRTSTLIVKLGERYHCYSSGVISQNLRCLVTLTT